MTQIIRQSNLLAAEDWRTIYRAFTEVNFNAYDFDSIRAAMVEYIRQNFPEDFNDYIESSEFVAIIDLLAYLGQSLAFRMDLNTRENFIDTAERRESILRLARLINYEPSRNRAATGLLKVQSIETTEDVRDSDGNNLANLPVFWNDANNPDWFEQFVLILNRALTSSNPFGRPVKRGTVGSIPTQLYEFNSQAGTGPVQEFTKTVSGTSLQFEVTNVNFEDNGIFFERSPDASESFHIVYRSDGRGNSSPNSGFFFQFKQGNLQFNDFQFDVPIENRVVDIDTANINNSDVFVQNIQDTGDIIDTWTDVPAIVGNNVIFNNLDRNIRNIYNVISRQDDQVSIRFADGRFGNIPTGIFRMWYRTSFGDRIRIRPRDMENVNITIPYTNVNGQNFTVTLVARLENTVDNSAPAETNEQIRQRAPQVYYTQNRMVNGQDYNVFPLQNARALKIKAVNRTYSGHSRFIDINDPTSSRQDANVFSDDGIFYREPDLNLRELALPTGLNPSDIVVQNVTPLLQDIELTNFFYEFYPEELAQHNTTNLVNPENPWIVWHASQNLTFTSSGTFASYGSEPSTNDLADAPLGNAVPVGRGSGGTRSFIREGSLVRFQDAGWVAINQILGSGDGILNSGEGRVKLASNVLTNDVVEEIIPSFRTTLTATERSAIAFEIEQQNTFGIRFDSATQSWIIIDTANLAPRNSEFSLEFAGDTTLQNRDASWLIRVEFNNEKWTFIARGLRYVFESVNDVRFFFLNRFPTIDPDTGLRSRDLVKIFKTNPKPPAESSSTGLEQDYTLALEEAFIEEDGFIEPRRVEVKFIDNDFDGIPDEPTTFHRIVTDNTEPWQQLVFQQRYTDESGVERWRPDLNVLVIDFINMSAAEVEDRFARIEMDDVVFVVDQQGSRQWYRYESSEKINANRVQDINSGILNPTINDLLTIALIPFSQNVSNMYRERVGRSDLRFQWKHFAPRNQRIDPAVTNVIDIFVLESNFDTAVREWIADNGTSSTRPQTPTSEDLRQTFSEFEDFKMISDEIVWRPVEHKILFGAQAPEELQAQLKIIKLPNAELSDGEIKSQVIQAINDFFLPENWNFGETFYFSELSAFIHLRLPTTIASIVLVPLNEESKFGRLYEVKSESNEIFVSAASVSDIQIIEHNTQTNLRIGD